MKNECRYISVIFVTAEIQKEAYKNEINNNNKKSMMINHFFNLAMDSARVASYVRIRIGTLRPDSVYVKFRVLWK